MTMAVRRCAVVLLSLSPLACLAQGDVGSVEGADGEEASLIQKRPAKVASAVQVSERSEGSVAIEELHDALLVVHADSEVKDTGKGRWVITVPDGCTDEDMEKMAEHMPAGTEPVFKGHPSEGGLCLFVMTGTKEQVLEEVKTHHWPSKPIVETDKTWQAIPEMPSDDPQSLIQAEQETGSTPPWGLDRIDDRAGLDQDYSAPPASGQGAGAHVYVMDTGIRTTHQDFGGRAIPTLEILGPVIVCRRNDSSCARDRDGHGTHCAGTVGGSSFGVAKAATLHAVKILGDDGSGSFSWLTEAIDWVLQNGERPFVASMSLGGPGSIPSVTAAIDTAVSRGLTVVVAAGNAGVSLMPFACAYSPAGVASAITVASTTRRDSRSSFSNIGRCLDIFAPGSGIVSASATSDTASATLSGTSMACPHVAGAAALLLGADASRSPSTIAMLLDSRSTTGAISNVGLFSPNKFLFTGGEMGRWW